MVVVVLVERLELRARGVQCYVHLCCDVRTGCGEVVHGERDVEDMLVCMLGRRLDLGKREDGGVGYAIEEVEERRWLLYCHRLSAVGQLCLHEANTLEERECTHKLSRRMGVAGQDVLRSTFTGGFPADVQRIGHARRGIRAPSMEQL